MVARKIERAGTRPALTGLMFFMNLTEEQKQAIETEGNISVIASAGTGKTTVLTKRFLHCHLERGAPLYNLLAFTFTEKASREMMARILESSKIPYMQAPQLGISTLHSFCQRLLKQHGYHLGLKAHFEIYDEESHGIWQDVKIIRFISQSLEAGDESVKKFLKFYGYQNLKATIRQLISQDLVRLDESLIKCVNDPEDVDIEHLNAFLEKIAFFQSELISQKIKNQILSYDDLEILTIRLFEEHPSILKKIQQQYKHILVDEYQDISPRQFVMIKKIFNPEFNELFIVGDPKQSIYGFRAADVRLFDEMVKLIENHDGKTIYLTETFRTPEKLQRYFNRVFPTILSGQEFKKATTTKADPETLIYAAPIPKEVENTAALHTYYAQQAADRVQDLIREGTKPEEIAMLFYAGLPIQYYKEAINGKGIKTVTKIENQLFDMPVVLVAWQIMKYISGERDLVTQVGILRNEIFSFTEGFVDQLIKGDSDDFFSGHTLDLFSHHKDKEAWIHLTKLIVKWRDLSTTLFATELFQTIVADIKSERTAEDDFFVQNFIRILNSWQREGLYYLGNLAQALKALGFGNAGRYSTPTHPDGVHLITIHGAKGLEFEHVFLVPGRGKNKTTPVSLFKENEGFVFKKHDCEEEKSLQYNLKEPSLYSEICEEKASRDSEELARLIYVALTRASKSLYFFLNKPSQQLVKNLERDFKNVKPIKRYNEWLYWLSRVGGQQYIVDHIQGPELDESEIQNENQYDLFEKNDSSLDYNITPHESQPTYTVTELETYFHCPKRFQLKFVQGITPVKNTSYLGIESKVSHKSKSQLKPGERGNLFHEILQYYDFETGHNLEAVIDQALFNQHIIAPEDSVKAECRAFMNRLEQVPLIRQLLFENLDSWAEVEFSYQLKNIFLTGQVDRLVKVATENQKEKYLILDYKTHHAVSENQRKALTSKFEFQMSCYALAMSKGLEVKTVDTLILFTSVPAYHVLEHTTEALDAFEDSLNTVYSQIQTSILNNEFDLTSDQTYCMSCPYFKDNYCGIKGD